jgi:putative membrane protein
MAKPFLTQVSKTALSGAVRELESCCSAEVVIAVRARTGSYLHAALLFGTLVGLVTLAVLLYVPRTFAPIWFLLDPLVIGLLAGLLGSRSARLGRVFTPWRSRRQWVEAAARSAFVERRVHSTTGRTGILLYVSVLEREAAFVVDVGVEALAATAGWTRAVGEIEQAVRNKEDGVAIAGRLRGLAPLLSPVLVRGENDVDELPNEVC